MIVRVLRNAAVGAAVALLGVAGAADAATISVFNDGNYVDTTEEGANLTTSIGNLGHTANPFVGITAADFTAATAVSRILVFPEMELANLAGDLDAAAVTVCSNFVSGGGTIIQANAFRANASLPNTLFGYALSQSGALGDTNLNAAEAAGTPFAGGPDPLPGSDAVEGMTIASLPAGALNLYGDDTSSAVFAADFGAGQYIYLGFDWFASPAPPEWEAVLGSAINTAVPLPATIVLLGSAVGLMGLGFSRRSRRT